MAKYTKVVLVVIAIIAISGLFFPRGNTVVQQVKEKLGAVSTLDGVDSPFVNVAGRRGWIGNVPMNATSTLVCSLKNPLAATSSIDVSARVSNRGAMTQTLYMTVATSSTQWATSTPALVLDYPMGTGTFEFRMSKNNATTTGTQWGVPAGLLPGAYPSGASRYILGPNDYIQWVVASTTLGAGGSFATYMTGSCSAELWQL